LTTMSGFSERRELEELQQAKPLQRCVQPLLINESQCER
jgi:hypothetical protein